jgi:ribonuclease HI
MYFLYFDGGKRAGKIGYGAVITTPDGEVIETIGGEIECDETTSNTSEYIALIVGLTYCVECGVKDIQIFGDSQLVIRQVSGHYKTKKPHLIFCRDMVTELLKNFDSWKITWIRREFNNLADRAGR